MDLVYPVMENLVFFLKVAHVPRSKKAKDKTCRRGRREKALRKTISLFFELRVPYSSKLELE